MRSKTISVAILCLLVFVPALLAEPQGDTCDPPPDLQREIVKRYPQARIVKLEDLEVDDRGFFTKDHGHACPGLVRLDFYGDGKPTLALALASGAGKEKRTELIMARKLGTEWKTTRIETASGVNPPVIWQQKPGTYTDVENRKVILATKPVVVFCGYEAWAIVYAWTERGIDKVWLLD